MSEARPNAYTAGASEAQAAPRVRGWEIALAVGLPAAALLWAAWLNLAPAGPPSETVERAGLVVDLQRPDALIETVSLSRLPRDLLDVPLLRDTLTEDFVYYYEHNADRLGLAGSLRRIAYEHELDLRDSLVRQLLDEPAEVALWRGADGRLGHALILLQRGALGRMLEPLARIGADSQLSMVGGLPVGDDRVPVYRLRYGYGRALLFASAGDRLLVLTSPTLLLDRDAADGRPAREVSRQLGAMLASPASFGTRFSLPPRSVDHRVTVATDGVAFGYGRFVPAFAALRFEFGDGQWQTLLAVDDRAPAELDPSPLWRAMPAGASACVAAPVSTAALQPVLQQLTARQLLPAALVDRFGGSTALCWYRDSRLHSPLLVSRLQPAEAAPTNAGIDHALGQAFEHLVGAGSAAGRTPVMHRAGPDGGRWQRLVGSSFGIHRSGEAPDPDALGAARFFRITLARRGDLLLFSLDDRLVDKALATLDRRFPPLADQLSTDRPVSAYVAPDSLAGLLEAETLGSLPRDDEAVFRNAAERSLLPKLRAFGGYPAQAISLAPAPGPAAASGWTWVPLQWSTP